MSMKLGIIQWTEGTTGEELVKNVKRLEELGYEELWMPEVCGREPYATAGYLLAHTDRMRISSGIANVFGHDADASAQAANTLSEFSNGRFTLGLGVSHPVLIEPRGHTWVMPVPKMNAYLDRMKEAPVLSPTAATKAPVIIAGHGPGLMKVAARKADGLFLFLQTVETVKNARAVIGPDKQLPVVVRTVFDSNPDTARDYARKACAWYMSQLPYQKIWSSLGYEESDWTNGGSDRLIDAICAWGDADMIREKLQPFADAGATQVVIYPCNKDEDYDSDSPMSVNWSWETFEALAPSKT